MNPSSFTQRSSSAALFAGATPGDCGSWQTPTKLSGYRSHDALDQVVAGLRPVLARRLVADVMRHRRRARREDREVGAALALELELRAFEALADLVVADARAAPSAARDAGSLSPAIWPSRYFCRSAGAVV